MITLMQVIQELRPGAQCRIIGDTYNDITWDDKNQTIPTEDEVDKKLKELQEGEPMALLREERNILLGPKPSLGQIVLLKVVFTHVFLEKYDTQTLIIPNYVITAAVANNIHVMNRVGIISL